MKSFGTLLLLVLLIPASIGALTVSEVARELSCRCGCNMTVDGCNHTNCPFAIPARKAIDEKISSGMGKEAIMGSFVAQYGEVVLAAPTKKGFNLAAWVLPFVMILVGGGIVRGIIRRWTRAGRQATPESERTSGAEDDEYQARVEKELKELDG